MSPSTLTRRPPATSVDDRAAPLLVLEPAVSTADLQPVVLTPGRYHLGSHPECDIYVPVDGVASRHCLIVVGPNRSVVKSLAPFTWLNDGLLREAALRPGDRLIAGPIEWTIGARASSDDTRTPADEDATAVDLLLDDARSRDELSQAASAARRDWERHQHAAADLPPTLTDPPVDQHRAHLAELAASLVAREQELVAREADVRCRWDELQNTWKSAQEFDRLTRSDRAAVVAEREQLLAERQALSAVRAELDSIRADLGRRALEIAEREAAAARQAEDVAAAHALLESRTTDLDRRDAEWTGRRHQAAEAESRITHREQELAQLEQQLLQRDEQAALREADLARHEAHRAQHLLAYEQRAHELSRREQQLAERERLFSEREQSLEHRSLELSNREGQHAERDLQHARRDEELSRREQTLAAREHDQQLREHQLREREQQQQFHDERVRERERQLNLRDERLVQGEQQLLHREQRLRELELEQQAREQRLREHELQLQLRDEQQTQREQQLGAQDRELANRLEAVTLREREAARVEQILSGRSEQLNQRERELDASNAQHLHRTEILSRQDVDLVRRDEELHRRAQELDSRACLLADREQVLAHREQALQQQTDALARREQALSEQAHDLARREQELAERDRLTADQSVGAADAVPDERPSALDADVPSSAGQPQSQIAFDLQERQRLLETEAQQLRADRDALELAQRELEVRWGGIEREQAALSEERSALERERVQFAAARDELAQLRAAQEADEAIWAKRRALLDAREQDLENRAAQLDEASAELAARGQQTYGGPNATLLMGAQSAGLASHPDESAWLAAAKALNESASKDLLDERAALDALRQQLDADYEEFATLRAEWDAQVADDVRRRNELNAELARLQAQAEEIRIARAELESERAVFAEQRHDLCRQLREFAEVRAAAEEHAGAAGPVTASPTTTAEELQSVAVSDAFAEQGDGLAVDEAPAIHAAMPDLAGHNVAADELQPETPASPPPLAATLELDIAGGWFNALKEPADHSPVLDELPPEASEVPCDAPAEAPALPRTADQEPEFREPQPAVHHWWPHADQEQHRDHPDTASVEFFSATGVYDAGAALAEGCVGEEDRIDEPLEGTIAWSPDSMSGVMADSNDEPAATVAAQSQTPPDAPVDDSVLALRARLAEMFGLSSAEVGRAPASHGHDGSSGGGTPARPTPRTVDYVPARAEEEAFAELPTDEDPQSAADEPIGPPAAELDRLHAAPAGAAEDETIAAYMERLLARSRPKLDVPDDLLTGVALHDSKTSFQLPIPPVETPPPAPPVATKTIAPADKEAIRANLHSFRELANISARSAVAKHQSAKLQTIVQTKFIVLAICTSVTFIMWVADWFSAGSHLAYTAVAAAATLAILAEVVRTVIAISRLKSLEAAGEYEAEASGALDDEPEAAQSLHGDGV